MYSRVSTCLRPRCVITDHYIALKYVVRVSLGCVTAIRASETAASSTRKHGAGAQRGRTGGRRDAGGAAGGGGTELQGRQGQRGRRGRRGALRVAVRRVPRLLARAPPLPRAAIL